MSQWERIHTANAGDTGLIPDPRRSHMPPSKSPCGQLQRQSLCSRTWGLHSLSPHAATPEVPAPKSPCSAKCSPAGRSPHTAKTCSPRVQELQKAHAATRTSTANTNTYISNYLKIKIHIAIQNAMHLF